MQALQIKLLGRFESLSGEGEPISLPMRKAEVLLAFLALAPGLRHPRERLINLLWSDRGEEQARNSLRQCLSSIRKSLGEAAELALQVDRTTVSLNAEMIEVDVLEFERLATDADYESLVTAADLYQGEFLEGIAIRDAACQEWLDSERARFKRQFVEILYNLAETQLVSHDYRNAARSAERLVDQDPLTEAGWRLLMQSYADSGDRGHALQAFKRCAQILRQELDVEPEAATVELRDSIATGASSTKSPAIARSAATTTPKSSPEPPASLPAIAVLPFDNLSGDPEQEYFSDGITDSIIMNLALFPDLLVKSRNSSFAFKQQIKSLGEISRELGVDYIVEGSVRRSSGRIRVNVQLISSGKGTQVWGKRYDAGLDDLFELEEDLSRQIAATVTGQIESDLQRIALSSPATDPQAYDLLLSGNYHLNLGDRENVLLAIDEFNRCLSMDPDNARVHANLFYCHDFEVMDHWSEDIEGSRRLAASHVKKAVSLAPDLGYVQVAYANYLIFEGQYDEAERQLQLALGRNPNDTEAITMRAVALNCQGKHEAALEHAELALRLDPWHPWARWPRAEALYFLDRYAECIEIIDSASNAPGYIRIYAVAASAALGRAEATRRALEKFLDYCRSNMGSMPRNIDEWRSYYRFNAPFADPTVNDRVIDLLIEAGLGDAPGSDTVAGRGNTDHAPAIAVLPFDNLSGDPGQEYFSDGITESIILNLSLFPGLHVKSRNSSFAFKQQLKGLSEISRELDVDYIVEGSIRKSKDRIRITAQLIEAASGNQVWGKRYDAELDDLFELEEELSRSIAATVTGRIESELQRIAVARGAAGREAYDLLLAGIHHAHQFTREDTSVAIELLEKCLQQDPGNIRAHKQLYSCHLMNYLDRWTRDYETSFELAAKHIRRALELAPGSDQVQIFYAQYLVFRGEFEQAAGHLDKALAINPSNPDALTTLALNLEMQGKAEAALEAAERSCRLDPYHPWAEWEIAVSQYIAGRHEAVNQTIARMRTSPGFIRIFGIASYVRLGRIENARKELGIFLQECRDDMLALPRSRDEWLRYTRENYPFADPRVNQELLEDLLRAGLEEHLASSDGVAAAGSQAPSIAVLPFDNLSGDIGQEYFSDGITESIILNLALFPGLHVKSRNSSFAFKQQLKGLAEISRELDVDYIVEGSIRKSRDRVRITAQLIDAANGNQVWGKRYDAGLDDLFELEENISREIAATVTGRIESELQRVAIAKGAADQEAYDWLLAGMYHVARFNAADNAIAIEYFERCLAQDPDNVRAHVGLYICYSMAYFGRWLESHEDSFDKARDYIQRALMLDPEDRSAQLFNAEMLNFSGKQDKAYQQIDRVLKKNPNDTDALAVLAAIQISSCEFDSAQSTAEHALKLDPYHPWAEWELAVSRYHSGNFEGALEAVVTMRAAPGFITLLAVASLVRLERLEEARELLREYMRECETGMKEIPRAADEWVQYTQQNYPFVDKQINRDLVATLVEAGLDDFFGTGNAQPEGVLLPSILVLPFANQSGDPEQEYFSDGITESVILNLSAFPGLQVKSRHASFAYKNSALDFIEIATELGVQYIVEGNIRKAGNKVRITAQLSETGSGNQIWGKRFDYDLADLFELEEDLSMTIAGAISTRIGKDARRNALRKPAKDLQSYDYYMRGSYYLEMFTAKDVGIAMELLEKCLALDPDNSLAHAKLGIAHMVALYENCAADRERSLELMDRHLARALEIDPDDAEAHAFMAERLMYSRDFDRALVHALKAVELNPTLADGYSMLAWHAGSVGQLEEARAWAEKSMRTDIHHPYAGWNAGEIYRLCGDYELAIRTFRSMAHLSTSVHAQIAACLAGLDRIDEARAEMRRYLELAREQMVSMPASRDEWYAFWSETMPYKHQADTERYFDLLLQAGLCDDPIEFHDDMPSIAVLPFKNLSGDSEQEYFSDGITASLILRLGMFRGLRVKSQNSSFTYRDSDKSSTEIANELGVDFLIEGSMRKSGSRVRLAVQLVEASSDTQIWGKQYDAEHDDILELEEQLSSAVAGTISGRIGHSLQKTASRKPARDLRSYDYLLRGLYHFGKFTARDLAIAREMIDKCLAIDPDNATAHTNLGTIHLVEVIENWSSDRQQSEESARRHLERAIELDPENALAHAYMSEYQLLIRRDYEQGEFHADTAIELNPTASEGYVAKADLLSWTNRAQEAIAYADKSLQLDPHSVGAGWAAGDVYRHAGLYQRAIKTFRSISHPPASVHALIASCFVKMELLDEARQEMQLYLQLAKQEMTSMPDTEEEWRTFWRANTSYQRQQDFEKFFDLLLGAGLLKQAQETGDEIPSIAVLPFENMSRDPEQEHFADGITADLVDTLTRFRHLRTVSRFSTLQYKAERPPITEIARQQQVRYILEGSVRRSGNRIRVNAELIDSGGEKILWSERYDRDLDDLFAVQDELTQSIALALKVQLDDGEMARIRSRGATSIKAWELTMAAVDLQDTYIRQNLLEARKLASEATRVDPDYAYAWISLGWTHWQEVYSGWEVSVEDSIAEAERALARAREIEPDYSEVYGLSGMIQLTKHNTEAAIRDCLRAVELEPGNAEIQALAAFTHVFAGEYEKGRSYERQVRRLCPVRANWYFLIDAQIEVAGGNFERAAEIYHAGIEVEPESPLCRFFLVDLMLRTGDEKAARGYADEIRALDAKVSGRGIALTYSADPTLRRAFHDRLAKFDLV